MSEGGLETGGPAGWGSLHCTRWLGHTSLPLNLFLLLPINPCRYYQRQVVGTLREGVLPPPARPALLPREALRRELLSLLSPAVRALSTDLRPLPSVNHVGHFWGSLGCLLLHICRSQRGFTI